MNAIEQNQALEDLDEMVLLVGNLSKFHSDLQQLILRNRFSSGQRRKRRGELGEMEGSSGTSYSDPTGETAVWEETQDATTKAITNMAAMIRKFNALADQVLTVCEADFDKKPKRIIPDCLACGDQVTGRVIAGFDEKCYKRWSRSGRPDRSRFIAETQADRAAANVSTDQESSGQ